MQIGKSSKRTADRAARVTASSGNVFADLKVAHPELALAKAELVQRIRQLIQEQALTQARAADLLDVDQPKISALVRGQVAGFSLDRLLRFLTALGQQVEITIRPKSKAAPKGADPAILVSR